jgi:hypothetical protein
VEADASENFKMNVDIRSVRVSLGGNGSIAVTSHDSGAITVNYVKHGVEQPSEPLPGLTRGQAHALADALKRLVP